MALVERAIRSGAITWHAGAMNMEYEWMNELALNQSLDLSVALARRFNVPVPCVVSVRDVPGVPIAIIRSLNQYFAQHCSVKPMVSVGVNPGKRDKGKGSRKMKRRSFPCSGNRL